MNFSVPKEYADFVTGAGDLLDQFNSGSSALETVSYSVYTLNGDASRAVEVWRQATTLLEPLVCDYLWHSEKFSLVIRADPCEPVSLFGSTCIGECIEDEWYIVYLLLKLSQHISDIVISVVDNDGQFLLMEGADHIEDWVGPENADNRVWIRNGTFHIIPLDEPGKALSGGMKLDKAIKCLLDKDSYKRSFGASEGFHRAIFQRTLHAFPARALANRHCALCIVPGWLANLINANAHVVARAVAEFHNADKDQLRQCCAASGACKGTTASPADQRLVLMPVQFTRALYAQLTFKNFHPPRKYHAMMRRVAEASSRKVSQAFDLGCRLACGVDCAYYNSVDANKNVDTCLSSTLECNPAWIELVNLVSARENVSDSLRRQLKTLFESNQISSTANFERHRTGDGAFPGGFRNFVDHMSRPLNSAVLEADQEAADREVFRSIVEGAVVGDAEDWLYMTPDELDKEMQMRVDRFAATSGADQTSLALTPEPIPASDAVEEVQLPQRTEAREDEASAAALQSMLDGFKTFMKGSSDIDGISFAPPSAAKRQPLSDKKEVQKPIPISTGGLELDYDLLESLLQGDTLPVVAAPGTAETQSAALSEEDQTEALAGDAAEKEKADLAGYFSKEDLRPLDSDDEEASEDFDSDDEDNRLGAQAADQFLESILQAGTNSNAPRHQPSATSPQKAVPNDAYQGVGGGYLQLSPSRLRGRSVEIDSDDEVEEVPRIGTSGRDIDRVAFDEEEDDEEDQDDMDEDLIREYQKLMDSELFRDSSLAQTFEWTAEGRAGGTDDDVDVDMNLLKNLMEAQSQGMGSPLAGPLGQLMSQLGITMPTPPPMKQRP